MLTLIVCYNQYLYFCCNLPVYDTKIFIFIDVAPVEDEEMLTGEYIFHRLGGFIGPLGFLFQTKEPENLQRYD